MSWRWLGTWLLLLAAPACRLHGSTPTEHIASFREVGLIPDPPDAGGRDVGYSILWNGASVWLFGDTFLAQPAADGYRWRASSWSWTAEVDASKGLSDWQHALGPDGAPLQLIPHTPQEQAFDDAHNGSPCPAVTDCGARHTAWPAAVVRVPDAGALIFYSKEDTAPVSSFSFSATGFSIASWPSPGAPALRPPVTGGPQPEDPTDLFGPDEPAWGAAAAVDADMLYAYGCSGGGLTSPCVVARVPISAALDRASWRFWNGSAWVSDWHGAVPVLEGAPLMSVHYSEYLDRWVAFYMVPLHSTLAMRLASRPEGPWSDAELFADGTPAEDGTWDYALIAHPELAAEGGRVEYLSYFQPGQFLNGRIHLVEVVYR